jgi:predicted neuraminidase
MRRLFGFLLLIFCSAAQAAHPSIVLEEFVFSNPPFASCHASTIAETEKGHLLCAWFGGSEEGAPDVKIWTAARDSAWNAPKEVTRADDKPCWNPVLFVLPSAEVLLFYKAGPHPTNWSGFLKRSDNHGKTWSEAELLPAGIIGPVRSKPLLLSNGTLLCGSSIESWQRWGCWVDITADGGKTWTKSNPINVESQLFGIIQPSVFFSKSGALRMVTRSHQIGAICTAFSTDHGKTWTTAQPTSLPNPNSAVETVNLKDGRVLLVYNHTKTDRYPLNVAVSDDGGETWQMRVVLEEKEGEFSYPAMIQTQDGLVHITYTWNRKLIKHVVLNPEKI